MREVYPGAELVAVDAVIVLRWVGPIGADGVAGGDGRDLEGDAVECKKHK